MWSPPNLARYASASTKATIASPTTPAAGTVQESVRSRSASAGSCVAMSTERSGLVSVGRGFIAPRTHRGDLDHVRVHLHAELAQERLAQATPCHARGGLARGGALEHVAHVAVLVLVSAHEIRMAGTRQVHLSDLRRHRPRVHAVLP